MWLQAEQFFRFISPTFVMPSPLLLQHLQLMHSPTDTEKN